MVIYGVRYEEAAKSARQQSFQADETLILARTMTSFPCHELLWLSCAAKRCCSVRTVRPTGGDIWRIARQLHVPPESFLRAIPAPLSAGDGVLFASHGKPMHVALARRAVKERQAACVFLMQIGDDLARCGLGALRPLPCQAFPGVGAGPRVSVAQEHGCTCRDWSLADLDRVAVADLVAREGAERELDRRLVHEWNVQVLAAASTTYDLVGFCGYLMHAYAVNAAEVALRGTT